MPSILHLAAQANAATHHYQDALAHRGYSDVIAAANALAGVSYELASAVADAVAESETDVSILLTLPGEPATIDLRPKLRESREQCRSPELRPTNSPK